MVMALLRQKVNEDLTINSSIDEHNKIQVIKVYSNVDDKRLFMLLVMIHLLIL